jgi:hypothetical protein
MMLSSFGGRGGGGGGGPTALQSSRLYFPKRVFDALPASYIIHWD